MSHVNVYNKNRHTYLPVTTTQDPVWMNISGMTTSSDNREWEIGKCAICDCPVYASDGIQLSVMKGDEVDVLTFCKPCFLTEPEAVKSLMVFEDLM